MRENELPPLGDRGDAQRIIDSLYSHIHKINTYPNSIIGALTMAYSVFSELEPDSIINEEDLDLSCKHLLTYTMVLSQHESGNVWEENIAKSAVLAKKIFGEDRANIVAQEVADEYDAMDEYFQEELDRPPVKDLN